MAETLESIKQEIAKIAAEKADLKGIVDQQKDTIKRQETTIGNLQEALKAADANMVDQVNKLQKEIDEYKKYADEEHTHKVRAWDSNGVLGKENEQLQKTIDELKEALADWKRIAGERKEKAHELQKQVALLESIDAEDHHEDVIELNDEVARLNKLLDTAYAGIANRDKEIDVLRADNEELKANGSPGMIAALAAKDVELRKLGEKVPAKDREINDLKEQVKSKNQDLEQSYKEFNKLSLEKEHLANAIENAYRSLMITRGYQLPDESGVSNG